MRLAGLKAIDVDDRVGKCLSAFCGQVVSDVTFDRRYSYFPENFPAYAVGISLSCPLASPSTVIVGTDGGCTVARRRSRSSQRDSPSVGRRRLR